MSSSIRIRSVCQAALVLCLASISLGAHAQSVASLLRLTVDGSVTDETFATSYGVETTLQWHLQEHGFTSVDLTPLHADFQQLRYTHDCPIVDGQSTVDDCAQLGNYAEAVLHALESIQLGVEGGQLVLAPSDLILIGEIRLFNQPREVRGELYYRLYTFADLGQVDSGVHHQPLRIQSKATRQGVTSEVIDLMVLSTVLDLEKNPTEPIAQ